MEEALKVVSFNVKRDSIFHGSHSWTNRRELVTRLIEESGAAIVGVQELMPAMKEDIRRLLTDYSIFGWGRTRKRTNEHSAILVHEPDWAAVYDQTFWLSKHPEKSGSRAYFAMFPRICTVCEVYSKELGQKIRVFNTHFDHVCGPARSLGRAHHPGVYAPVQPAGKAAHHPHGGSQRPPGQQAGEDAVRKPASLYRHPSDQRLFPL